MDYVYEFIEDEDTESCGSETVNNETVEIQHKKCGEIFIQRSDEASIAFMFSCVFCNKASFTEVSDFFKHFQEFHLKPLIACDFNILESVSDGNGEFIKIDALQVKSNVESMTLLFDNNGNEATKEIEELDESHTETSSSKHIAKVQEGSLDKLLRVIENDGYPCESCEEKYLLKSSLQRHRRLAHSNKDSVVEGSQSYFGNNCEEEFGSETDTLLLKYKDDHQTLDLCNTDEALCKENEYLYQEEDVSNEGDKEIAFMNPNSKVLENGVSNENDEIAFINQNSKSQDKGPVFVNPSSRFLKCNDNNSSFLQSLPNNSYENVVSEKTVNDNKNEELFDCDMCDRKFAVKLSLQRHKTTMHNVISKSCEFCSEKFKTEDLSSSEKEANFLQKIDWKIHECASQDIEMIKAFFCKICGKKYSLKSSIRKHIKYSHMGSENSNVSIERPEKITISCSVCDKKFKTKGMLIKHQKYDHQPTDVFLELIEAEQSNGLPSEEIEDLDNKGKVTNSTLPVSSQHSGSNNPRKCRYCGRLFNKRCKRIVHEYIHTGEKPYKCKYCEKTFRLPSSLKRHENFHEGKKPHKCTMCDAAYTDKSNLQQHIRRHLGDKKLPCQYCGKLFILNSERKVHERTHTGEKPFQCSQCGMCFTTSERLFLHNLKHANNTRYKCEYCDKKFFTKYGWSKHNLIHTGERPFQCEICNATFMDKGCLRKHVKAHLNIAEHECKICSKVFKFKSNLKNHMKIHGV